MINKERHLLQKARDYAFLLLKFRPRSEKELCVRFKKKRFDEATIRETVFFLKDKGLLDDESFTRSWIESRIKKPLGLRRISQELSLKGIDREIARKEMDRVKEHYREEDVVLKIARQRLIKLKGAEPQKAKMRIYAYLLRRGFLSETITDALNKLCKQTP